MGTKVLRSGHLSASQLAALRQLMEQEDVRTLRGTYDAKPSVKDYRRVLDVRIRHARDLQTFTLLGPLDGFQGKFPGPVVQLFCAIDKLRETDFKMSKECAP